MTTVRLWGGEVRLTGLYVFGVVALIMCGLKLTVFDHWTWWRAILPLATFVGFNVTYAVVGFIYLTFAKLPEQSEKEQAALDEVDDLNPHYWNSVLTSIFPAMPQRWESGRSRTASTDDEGGRDVSSTIVLAVWLSVVLLGSALTVTAAESASIPLPSPRLDSDHSIESALHQRRTIRDIADAPISLASLGQLLWAAQGISSPKGLRTAPSAGALYPLEIHVVVGNVQGLPAGLYHYRPRQHELVMRHDRDLRAELSSIAANQAWVAHSAAILAYCAVPSRTTRKYGSRGEQYVLIEVGHSAQNVLLQAQSLGLATGVVGAFEARALNRLLKLPRGEHALYLVTVGKPAG